jgi:hypothetical protein
VRAGNETLRCQAGANSPLRLPDIVGVTHEAQVKFVDGGCANGLRVGEIDELPTAEIEGVEPGHSGAALAGRIGIVYREVVKEIVARKRAVMVCISVKAKASFVVARDFSY